MKSVEDGERGASLPVLYTVHLIKSAGFLTVRATTKEELKNALELIAGLQEDGLVSGIDIRPGAE